MRLKNRFNLLSGLRHQGIIARGLHRRAAWPRRGRCDLSTVAPSMGLISMPSFSASSRTAGSLHIAMNASPSALARSAGTPGGAANVAEAKWQIADWRNRRSRQRVRVLGQLFKLPGRHVGKIGQPGRLMAELQQRAERVVAPQIALWPGCARNYFSQHADLGRQSRRSGHRWHEHRRRADIAAHHLDVEAENLPWRWWRRSDCSRPRYRRRA